MFCVVVVIFNVLGRFIHVRLNYRHFRKGFNSDFGVWLGWLFTIWQRNNSWCNWIDWYLTTKHNKTLKAGILTGTSWWRHKWKHFPRYRPFARGIHCSSVDSLTKAIDAELWCFFNLRPNRCLSKQSRRRWNETPSRSLWRHGNVLLCVRYNG